MARGARIAIGLLAGAVAGGLVAIAGGVAAGAVISQFEGAYAMQVAFFWTPLGIVAGAIVGAILGGRPR